MRRTLLRALALSATLAFVVLGPARSTERSEVPKQYKWNLADLFPTEAAWRKSLDDIKTRTPTMAQYQGHLGDSPQALLKASTAMMALSQDLDRVNNYPSQLFDQDTRVSHSQEMEQAARSAAVDFYSTISYVRPEIIAMGKDKVEKFLAAEPGLAEFRPYLENILRAESHTLSPEEEKISAMAGNVTNAGGDVSGILRSADMPFPEITLSDGTKVRLDDSAYTRYRASTNREDRMKVFHAFWQTYKDFTRTYATTLYAQVKAHIFNKDVHHFDSCLAAALFSNNIPTEVYTQLIDDTHKNLPTLYRYLKLRKRMMGLDDFGYEDIYAPIVKSVDMTFTPEQAMDATLKAVAPLGADYVATLKNGMSGGWMDWMPTTGKRSGAYSTIAYGTHPYQLMNFDGHYEGVTTLAHESGHSMHSYLSTRAQPYVTADYATFVAEVASTLNENLLLHSMLADARDDDTRLFLLGTYLDNLRGTIFRQVQFAEFELKAHQMAESGQPLSAENLSNMYLGLLRQYYGADQGVCRIDSLYAAEWAYIPHFYYNFYVFQYATSMIASTSLARGISEEAAMAEGKHDRRDAYLKMLSSGSSKYPIELLREAGVDMTTSRPYEATIAEMNSVMDQMEAILTKQGK